MSQTISLRNRCIRILIQCRRRLMACFGGVSVGVRALVVNEKKEVLLVKHTYTHGWHLPGGGVDKGESPQAAALRELLEETGYRAAGTVRLLSAHHQMYLGANDYPLVYHIERVELVQKIDLTEIVSVQWWPLTNLPPDTTRGTRERIGEYLKQGVPAQKW